MKTETGPVACIVLNWNGGQDSVNCLGSLLASQSVNLEVVVLDNGSTDGSPALLGESFPQVTLLRNPKNFGVAKAWNAGVRWALEKGTSHIFFLNNDAEVEPTCLAILLKFSMLASTPAIVSPRILDGVRRGRTWFDGGIINAFGDAVHRHLGGRLPSDKRPFDEDFATGCAMLVNADIFKGVGFFDESYFAYSEDADLCLRAKARGFSITHVPEAVVTHFSSQATIKNKGKWFRDYYVTRNRLLLTRKYARGAHWILFLAYFFVRRLCIPITYNAVTGQFKRIRGIILGVWDFAQGRFGERYS